MVERQNPFLKLKSGTPDVDAIYEWFDLGPTDTLAQVPTRNLWVPQGLVVGDPGGALTAVALAANTLLGRLGGDVAALDRDDLLTLLQVVLAGGTAGEAGKLVKLDGAGHLDLSVIPPGVGGGAINGGSNLGAGGVHVFAQVVADLMEFRSLRSTNTDSLRLLQQADQITLSTIFSDTVAGEATRHWSSAKVESELAALNAALTAAIATKIGALSEDGAPTLGANLDILTHSIMAGAVELLRYDSGAGELLLLGAALLVPDITTPLDGDVITYDGTAGKWVNLPNGGGGAVASVFGRVGVVIAAASDYDASQVDNDSGVAGADVAAALDTLDGAKSDTSHGHGNVSPGGPSGFMTGSDKTKLDAIESNAAADQTGAEIKTAYELQLDTNAYTDAEKTKLAGIDPGATDDQVASEVPLTPVGGVAATDVQAAIAELDTEKSGTGHTHAAAVAGGASGFLTGSDKSKLDGVEASAKDDQVASEVGFTPTGAIAATNVQAALAELDTEKAAASHTHAAADIASGTLADARVAVGNVTQHAQAVTRNSAVSGTSFPGSPSEGDIFFRTDHREWYSWDNTNSVWLGEERIYTFGKSGTGHNDTDLRCGDSLTSATNGAVMVHDVAVTRIVASWNTTVLTGDVRVRRDGTDVASLDMFNDASNTVGDTGEIYATFNKRTAATDDGRMEVYLDTLANALGHPIVQVHVRRRET